MAKKPTPKPKAKPAAKPKSNTVTKYGREWKDGKMVPR